MSTVLPQQFHLGSYLGQAVGGGLSKGINQFFEQKQQNEQRQKQLEGLTPFLQAAGFGPEQIQQLAQSGLDPQQAVAALGNFQKQKKMSQEEGVDRETLQNSFDRLWQLSGELGWSALSPNFGFNTEKRGEFESEKASLVAALRDLVNKGVLSNQKFQYFVNKILPSHGDTKGKKRGNLKGVANQLGLNIPGMKQSQKGGKTVNMRDPSTGNVYAVPQGQVNAFRQKGAELVQ